MKKDPPERHPRGSKSFIPDYNLNERVFEWKRIFYEIKSIFHAAKQIWKRTIVLKLTGTLWFIWAGS